jgi:hypothetical protein
MRLQVMMVALAALVFVSMPVLAADDFGSDNDRTYVVKKGGKSYQGGYQSAKSDEPSAEDIADIAPAAGGDSEYAPMESGETFTETETMAERIRLPRKN